MKNITKLNNIFSDQEIKYMVKTINDAEIMDDPNLGRQIKVSITFASDLTNKVTDIANNVSGNELLLSSITYVEYNNKYGTPNLPPHFDGDTNDLIFNFQLESNTSWNLGLDLEVYELEDNSALLFNPNELIHWRPIKEFQDNEYVKMIFFRFKNLNKQSDYSHMRYSQNHEIFKEVNELRNSLNNK